MRRIIMSGFCLGWLGCSEYDVKSTDGVDPGDGFTHGKDTAAPFVPDEDDEDTAAPDEGIIEDPPPEEDPPADTGEPCSEVVTAFDIEEVSSLQDAASPFLVSMMGSTGMYEPWYRDALVLDYTVPESGPGESWRVSAVYVLVMVPTERFDMYVDGENISVEVYDGEDPRTSMGWTVTQAVYRDDLEWSDYALPLDAAISGHFSDFSQKGAWMRFDLTGVIPGAGMSSTTFIAGIQWESLSPVGVGYSNFNRACNRNWTEWSPGSGWQLNGDLSSGSHCSWPMLRVEIEHTYSEDCR
jgi:hypothetical protein